MVLPPAPVPSVSRSVQASKLYLNYSVYDLVAGSTTAIKAGAVPVQTPNYAPNLGIGVTNN